jgi:hypothetical protein
MGPRVRGDDDVVAMTRFSHLPIVTFALAAIALASAGAPALAAENSAIASRQRAEKKSFTDAEIIDGFFKTAFGAEFIWPAGSIASANTTGRCGCSPRRQPSGSQGAAGEGRRRHRPARPASRHRDGRNRDDANVVVTLVRDRDLFRTIQRFYGSERAREIAPRSIRNACPAFARTRDSKSSIPT